MKRKATEVERKLFADMDPLSVAGLTIAVLDQLWKIGERTAELVSNYRDFDTVSRDVFLFKKEMPFVLLD